MPFENLVGRAEIIFFSIDDDAAVWEIWKWPWTFAGRGFFKCALSLASGRPASQAALERGSGTPSRSRAAERALTHASAATDAKADEDYQRLEFLGDRVLGLVVADC